jgi:Ca2+-binding EF-hand superfamily protein
MQRACLVVVFLFSCWAPLAADDAPLRSSADATLPARSVDVAAADVQDLILFTPLKPLVLRLHVALDKTPFRQAWQERIEQAFAEIDTDGDRRITVEQAGKLTGMICGPGREAAAAELQRLAADGASLGAADMVAYFLKAAPPLVVREEPSVSGTAIFAILDSDGDRRLSMAELQSAEQLLRRRDFNDDEVITADELIDDPRAVAKSDMSAGSSQGESPSTILALGPDVSREQVAAALLKHYDRNHDGQLSIAGEDAELLPEPAIARQLTDADSGRATADELAAAYAQHFDLEVSIPIGAGPAGTRRSNASGKASAFTIHRRLTGDLRIDGRGLEIELRRHNRNPARNIDDEFPFADYDGDKNGYLDEAECRNAALVAGSFAAMDADGDGKVSPAEFKPYLHNRVQAASTRLVLRVINGGQDLFDLLDSSSDAPDHQLSVREILAAPQLIAVADRNGDNFLAGDEITQRLTLELFRVSAEFADPRTAGARLGLGASKRETHAAGPDWFVAMDRNQDGDLSAREFLGTVDAFTRLDANRDGLIDADEAAAAP